MPHRETKITDRVKLSQGPPGVSESASKRQGAGTTSHNPYLPESSVTAGKILGHRVTLEPAA